MTTKLTKPIEREADVTVPDTGKPMIVELFVENDVPRISLRAKGSRTKRKISLERLWLLLGDTPVAANHPRPTIIRRDVKTSDEEE